jgi:hyperosmotically inducible protein
MQKAQFAIQSLSPPVSAAAESAGVDCRQQVSCLTILYKHTRPDVRMCNQRGTKMKRNFMKMFGVAALLALAGVAGASTGQSSPTTDTEIAARAAHEIRMYPRYSIWDNVALRVNDGALEITGQVSQPYKKQDLERLMQRVPGVASVTNELEMLPVSFTDDNLRARLARAIYRDPVLSRYAIQAIPPIHIIVKNGHVTLEGVVSTEMEKNVAAIRASSAGLSFGPVQNNLRVENPKPTS